eukprot:Mycagemm_TRINITY_DN10110_c0_g1::TRINITY_DN10110_c0_g1_i1::g.5028::m.5028 type:complete len:113 gc:universal TRINITY_DN10110_c0_g1_i1:508-846(+)
MRVAHDSAETRVVRRLFRPGGRVCDPHWHHRQRGHRGRHHAARPRRQGAYGGRCGGWHQGDVRDRVRVHPRQERHRVGEVHVLGWSLAVPAHRHTCGCGGVRRQQDGEQLFR